MEKSLPSITKLQQISRIVTSHHHHHRPKLTQHFSATRVVPPPEPTKPKSIKIEPEKQNLKMENNNKNSSPEIEERFPLAAVVNDCVRRWFLDTLKEAKAGDTTMQVLVGQMYNSGYGVTMNAHKGNAWIERASRSRSSARKVGDKRPGYNASDSDSDKHDEVSNDKAVTSSPFAALPGAYLMINHNLELRDIDSGLISEG